MRKQSYDCVINRYPVSFFTTTTNQFGRQLGSWSMTRTVKKYGITIVKYGK